MESKGLFVSLLIQTKAEKVPIFGHILTQQVKNARFARNNTKNNSVRRDP